MKKRPAIAICKVCGLKWSAPGMRTKPIVTRCVYCTVRELDERGVTPTPQDHP